MSSFLDTTHRNVIWFKRAMEADELQMKPPFQRNPVWTENQKSYLIDTILRGYPIPEIYIQDIVKADGSQTHVVVDGQQRIRACLEYLEAGFTLDREQSPEYGDASFEDLRDEDKQKIYSYKFVIRLLPDAPETTLREVFQRLNRNNVALNQQELRQATYWGPFIQTMNKLADDEYWAETGIFTPNDVRRMLDVEYISEMAIGIIHGPQNKKQSLDKWYAIYEKEFEQQKQVEAVFAKAIGELQQVLPTINKTRWRKKSDFYTLFLVLAAHSDALPLSSDRRDLASKKLLEFQEQVDKYLKYIAPRNMPSDGVEDDGLGAEPMEEVAPAALVPGYPREVIEYAAAVQRAASDLAPRRTRIRQLEAVLTDVWKNGTGLTAKSGS